MGEEGYSDNVCEFAAKGDQGIVGRAMGDQDGEFGVVLVELFEVGTQLARGGDVFGIGGMGAGLIPNGLTKDGGDFSFRG